MENATTHTLTPAGLELDLNLTHNSDLYIRGKGRDRQGEQAERQTNKSEK